MKSGFPYHRWLHRFATFTACATFCLVIAGGLVTSTDSGLAVPDWPLSYGQLMPPMVGGIFYEHGHRMVATAVGILTTILAIWLWKVETRRWVRILGGVALFAVILQGVLGGLTVLYLLPTPISVAHATLAQSFFCLTITLALVTSKGWLDRQEFSLQVLPRTRILAISAAAAVLVQLVIGAWMRHSGAGLAIPDFPLSFGNILPPTGSDALDLINRFRLEWFDLAPVSESQVWIHFAHRVGALVVLGFVLTCAFHILKAYPSEKRLREPAIVMVMLVCVQALLGALTVWTGKGVQIATSHVAAGALLFGTCVYVTLWSFHGVPATAKEEAYAPLPHILES
jgi:cytochrome c oxidase assembly protein subunit 15